MGIELNTNNSPTRMYKVVENKILSHAHNGALLIVDSAIDIDLIVSRVLSPGFTCTVIQRGIGKANFVEADGRIHIINKNAKYQTSTPGDIAKLMGGYPGEFFLDAGNGGGSGYKPIKITQADFSTATAYNNATIVGASLAIFLNEINRYLQPDEWEATPTGINILIPGFDATAYEYLIVIYPL